MKLLTVLICLTSTLFAQTVDATRRKNGANPYPQVFFGTAAPGSVTGNLPGDLFYDTTNHNFYGCNATSGTAAPACASVTPGGWTLFLSGNSVTGSGAVVLATSPTLTTPNLGTPSALTLTNATGLPIAGITGLGTGVATALAASVSGSGAICLATGSLCGVASTTITTGTTATLSTAFTVNQEATAAAGVTYTLPTASSGAQFCVDNGYNGSAATTGVLTLATSATGQFLVYTDGSLSATGGNVTSGGAARDGACVYGIDSTHWMFLPHSQSGTAWTKH